MATRKSNKVTQVQKAANSIIESRNKFLQTNPSAINYKLRTESIAKLKEIIMSATEIANMDQSKIAGRITAASSARNEYGRVSGLMNLLATIINWPSDSRKPDGLNETRQEILDSLGMDFTIFEDLKSAKGYHTFTTDEHSIEPGVEPAFEEYNMLVELLASELGLSVVDVNLDEDKWHRDEVKAIESAQSELDAITAELELHQQLHGAA